VDNPYLIKHAYLIHYSLQMTHHTKPHNRF